MKNNLKSINLLQRLIERLNNEVYEMSYTFIAEYLLNNYRNIKSITIEQICSETFVSKSTLRRFCNSIGYQNFREMKNAYSAIEIHNYPVSFDVNLNSLAEYDKKDIRLFTQLLINYKKIFFLFPYDLYSSFYDFQREMIYRNKLVYLVPNIDLHFDNLHKLDDALLVVVDFDNCYSQNLIPYMERTNAAKICLTNNDSNNYPYNHTIHFRQLENPSLRKYQLMFFLDCLADNYQKENG